MAQKITTLAQTPPHLTSIEVSYSDLTFERRVGGGGFSEVFKGLWQRTIVAIKKLKIEEFNHSITEEFQREVYVMSGLRHPHIVNFYKACFEAGKYCIVMEFYERGSLYHWLKTSEAEAWPSRKRIALEVSLGLSYLHGKRVIHRDLKSLNVLLDSELKAKIADFGLSKIKMESSLTSVGQASVVGTLRWNPPELLSGDVTQHSTKTDMYSYGMVLWEIATRTIPFAQQANDQIVGLWIMQHRKEKIPEETPKFIKALIERCRDESEKRPSAEQAVKELEIEVASSMPPSLLIAAPISGSVEPVSLVTLAPPASVVVPPPVSSSGPVLPKTNGPKVTIALASDPDYGVVGLHRFNTLLNEQDMAQDATVKCYQKAAEQGNADAQKALGLCYHKGQGVTQDYKEAMKWFRKAAEQGNADAQNNLGNYYYSGLGVPQNYKEAVEQYQKAANQDNAAAQYGLGNCHYSGLGVPQNYKKAVEQYQKAANQGNSAAQYVLGICYYDGRGVHQDYKEAVKWWQKASEQGHLEAQFKLYECYCNGQGTEKNYKLGQYWCKRAADQGHSLAQGHCYYFGFEVPQDYKEAVKHFQKAAEQGNADAQTFLGKCYYDGQGVTKDYKEAVKLFRKAAERGDEYAQHNLGICYKNGRGVPQDYKEAVKLFRKAADQGHVDARKELGFCYRDGKGVAKDMNEAAMWLSKAGYTYYDLKNLLQW